MTLLAASLMRPAKLSEVRSPGILLQVGQYGASFLVVGPAGEETAIFLDERHRFQSFRPSGAENWQGLAIEDVEFELDTAHAIDLGEARRSVGMMIRRDETLSIAVVPEGPFSRGAIEVRIQSGLPMASEGTFIGFLKWRAFVRADDEQRTVWENSPPQENT
jgi:hypothetical protein